MSSAPANSGDVPSHSPGFATGATAASASVDVFSSASAVRIEELQRTLEALYRDILFPFYEPVERLRVVTNRAIRIQDVVDAVAARSRFPDSHDSDESRPSAAALVSSSSIHGGSCAGEAAEEAPLAPTLFHLLQLRRWGDLHPAFIGGAHSSGVMAMPEQMSRGTPPPPPAKPSSQQEGDLVGLNREVRALGDLLRAYHFSYRPLPMCVPKTTPSISNTAQRSRGGSRKDKRAPAQLVATSTDAEEAWLLPLQRDVVQCVLRRLQVMELVLKRLVARGTSQKGGAVGSPAKAVHEEVTAFFAEEIRVVAELVALRGVHERDAQSLSCLVHVLTAAADAGVVVSVATLVEAAAAAVQHSQCGVKEGRASVATTAWRSCVPWLLHCYSTTDMRVSPSLLTTSVQTLGDDAASWSTASAWMTAAADRVCATQSTELLQLTPTPAEARWKGVVTGSGADTSVQREKAARAHTFCPWQGVLDAEATETAEAQTYTFEGDGGGNRRRAAGETWLRDWCAGCGITDVGGESNSDSTGTWHPYWKLVVSGMVRSCARAVDAIVELSEGTGEERCSDELSSARPKTTRHRSPASSNSTLATLEEIQFYAVGSYVSLRRIASSLQRHHRLMPLLQLHEMVSGFVGPSGAVAGALLPPPQRRQWHENNAPRRRADGVCGSLSTGAAAAQWRRRLLSGELLQPLSTAPGTQGERRRHRRSDRPPPAYLPQRHQAGAMLWREVALFDAYTLITIGHVSEHAVDGAEVDKNAVLQQLAWLQQECAQHLTVLEASDSEVTERVGTDSEPAESGGNIDSESSATKDRGASYSMPLARRSMLLRCLKQRTRAGLIAKLQEGLRLSAKVLARWGTPEQICALYLRYPSMGASWEVGRALLQCGQYSVAVEVLESLLQASATARGASATYPSAVSSTSSPPLLLSNSAIAVRQLLLEAMEGAAAALVQHSQQCHAVPASASSSDAAATSIDGSAGGEEVPLPAELRTRLHSLYAHLYSLPIPLPLCLHAVVRGLTSASEEAAVYGIHNDADATSPLAARRHIRSKFSTSADSPSALRPPSRQPHTSAEERARTTAVLCTYALRCHLAENPHKGLLAKTVELWASCVAPYLCRRSCDGAEASPASPLTSLKLSLTDQYLRAVTARILCGYPQLPVARLLLSRLVQLMTPPPSMAPSGTLDAPSTDDADNVSATSDARVALTVVWLLGVLYKLAGMPAARHSATSHGSRSHANVAIPTSLAYRLCVPVTTTTASTQDTEKSALMSCDTQLLAGCRAWNAGFTERYALDTLRLMPRIALEALERLLRSLARHSAAVAATSPTGSLIAAVQRAATLSGRSVGFFHDRVSVILQYRRAEEEQRQPWQCSACYLWNSRYARACKRCHALSTVLLQCRACGCLTSSADDRDDHGLSCDVCGIALVPPLSFQSSGEVPQSSSSAADPLLCASTIDAGVVHVRTQDLTTAAGRRFAAAAAATVTGTGRAANRFTASAAIARVVPLRQWTCMHCRTVNDPQHVFFCRGCGRATTDPEKREAAASAAGVDGASNSAAALACEGCRHSPKSIEARMRPWCERCGALYQRVRELHKQAAGNCTLSSSTNSPSHVPASATGTIPPTAASTGQHSPYLWWCAECTAALNPWTRTHCELCGAGRPAASAAVPEATPGLSLLSEKYNAAAPFIVLPWLMQACHSCKAQSRVGMLHCWQCHALLTWPLEVQRAVSDGWRRWVTQVAHIVMDVRDTESQTEDGAACSSTGADTPLHVPCGTQWLCLHDGCMHVNVVHGAAADAYGDSGATPAPLCHTCTACAFAPRRPAEVLSPFHDRFAWSEAAARLSPTNAALVVEALLLPPSSPLPGDVTMRHSESFGAVSAASEVLSAVRSEETAATAPQSHERWLHRSWLSGVATTFVCTSCGASGASGAAAPSTPLPVRLRPLFMVNVCASCGFCAWGRSSCAYDIPGTPCAGAGDDVRQQPSSSPARGQAREGAMAQPPLLPGEHAMALRLLLKALAHAVREWVALELPPSKRVASRSSCTDSGKASMAASSPVSVTGPSRRLDWAWLSRFVLSGVRLITSSASEALPHGDDSRGGSCALRHQHCLHERLPWRGCDLASPQQACSAEPRVAVLESRGHGTGTVHSAIVDVRQVLDGVCALAEHRVRGSLSCSRSPRRRHRGKGDHAHQQHASPPALPPCLQDAWTRRLILAALELIDVVNASTVFDDIGFATLRRLCLLLRPDEVEHINTETKWTYLQDMKLSRSHVLRGCVQCEQCLTTHGPDQPCAAP
ncbi:hypothetical protein CGC20_32250 [Leishmania donovani]|uniref:RanBP2-type domain-containing protein n=1 Tax=Leishmania donovani TaxID=5661 RepID=A0A504XAC8_LEIDO|nr:hypothetical protein CGC20_32250 [Leishmania donovani]